MRSKIRVKARWWRGLLTLGLLAALGFAALAVAAKPPRRPIEYATATPVRFTPVLNAYATVVPAWTVAVRAAESGVLTGFTVLPGSRVRAGQVLGRLEGPSIRMTLAQNQANLLGARQQLTAARKSLAIDQRELPSHLSTRVMVHQAEAAVAQARSRVTDARASLNAVRGMATLTAPSSGTVLSLSAGNGELLARGQALLTLQPAGKLVLRATLYGAAIGQARVGMRGSFKPAGGGAAMPVRIARLQGAVNAGGGEVAWLRAVGRQLPGARTTWLSGEYGTLVLHLAPRTLVAIPTRSLILDRGHWWVLLKTPRGLEPREVTPGPARGWQTYIEQGLQANQQVVVTNAYLLFHRNIANRFQMPD